VIKNIKEIVIASHNKGKVREIRSLLKPMGLKIYSAKKFTINEPIEDGKTFKENSLIKSKNAALKSGIPAIADDSGLCILSLDNKPGIYSARWAGRKKNFNLAINKIENEMRKNKLTNKAARKAFFCCALSIYFPNNNYRVFEGKKYGHIQFPASGKNGFGYDPIFVPNGYKKTFGEMNFTYKERISHRSIAFKKMKEYLKNIIS
jgi:XTP/dITP diphosphohydrolase